MIKRIILGGISTFLVVILLVALFWYLANWNSPVQSNRDYVGSVACGECHQREYALWAKTAHALQERNHQPTDQQGLHHAVIS